jgi:ABC-type sugar transport system ATPase subunit
MDTMASDAVIRVRGLDKRYPGVHALCDVGLEIQRNTVHCIVGENGAGKSTFIKILTGATPRSGGEMELAGRPFEPRSVRDAMSRGISVLYQELNVVDDLTVEENLTLGKERSRLGFIRKSPDLARTTEILAGLDDSIHLSMRVGDLSVAQKQVIEIARAVSAEASVLVMDEPTAALSEEEVRRLFAVMRKLKASGMTIIFISHKLAEVFEIGDVVTVFRDGAMVGTQSVEDIRKRCRDVPESCLELVKLMLGKVVVEAYVPSSTDRTAPALEVRGVSNRKLRNVAFELFKGEILGFYGLVGAGKTEVARVLYGVDPYQGEIRVRGRKVDLRSTRGALAAGLALVPEERRADGIFGVLSIRANIPMMRMGAILQYGMISGGREKSLADRYISKLSVAARSRDQRVALLSGGNQQKVVIAKCLNRESDILLMDEPTRGVDVGAKHEIHGIIRALANEGKSIVVFSSELPEILHLCDRIALMHDGALVEVLPNEPGISSDHIMAVVAGGRARA